MILLFFSSVIRGERYELRKTGQKDVNLQSVNRILDMKCLRLDRRDRSLISL